MLRTASSTSQKCQDHLQESRPCEATCFFRYEWSLTEWSSCQPVGDSSCGDGRRKRGAKCLRLNDNRTVKDSFCRWQDRPADLEAWCPIDCPVDCEVSAWSSWDHSQCSCGKTSKNMTRTRVVITEASPSGRPCPAALKEAKPCVSLPCYALHYFPSVCDMQGAACGVGTALLNVTCVRRDVAKLDPPEDINRCSRGSFFGQDSDCFKPCPTDCLLSDWSPWSQCQGACVGYKTCNALFYLSSPSIVFSACESILNPRRV